jgi:tetratricopeptide (TPR) repeat protein
LRDAAWHLNRQETAQAVARLEDVVRLDPTNGEAWFHLGNARDSRISARAVYEPSADVARSREAYSRAVRLGFGTTAATQDRRIEALAALARSYAEQLPTDAGAAVAFATQLSREFPGDPRAQFLLARTFERVGRTEETAAAYGRLEAAFPDDGFACETVAEYHWRTPSDRQPLWHDALTRFERCAGLRPDDPDGHYKVAAYHHLASMRAGLVDDARRGALADRGLLAADRALTLRPGYTEAMIVKAMLLRVKAQTTADPLARAGYEREAAAVFADARRPR